VSSIMLQQPFTGGLLASGRAWSPRNGSAGMPDPPPAPCPVSWASPITCLSCLARADLGWEGQHPEHRPQHGRRRRQMEA
jgi:hypothetical protein